MIVSCIDIRDEGRILGTAIQTWLSATGEISEFNRVFKELFVQLLDGMNSDPTMFALYMKDMPGYTILRDLNAVNTDRTIIDKAFKEAASIMYFKLKSIPNFPFEHHDHMVKHLTYNSLYIESYPS